MRDRYGRELAVGDWVWWRAAPKQCRPLRVVELKDTREGSAVVVSTPNPLLAGLQTFWQWEGLEWVPDEHHAMANIGQHSANWRAIRTQARAEEQAAKAQRRAERLASKLAK